MTETASAQNRSCPGLLFSLPSGASGTTDGEGRLMDIPASDAEWLISTPGWARVGEDPARPSMINPLGKRPPADPIATELGDPTAAANDLADHLLKVAAETKAPAADETSEGETPAPELPEADASEDDAPALSLAEEIKAAKKRGVSVPKAVKAKGVEAVRAYLVEAATR